MTIKAIISKINIEKNAAELILPEYDNAVTGEIPFYNRNAENASIGEFVILSIFNNDTDFQNGVIL